VRRDVTNLVVSTGLFSIAYSMLIFTIPLFAVSVGSSESELGFIAMAYTLPSLFVPILVGGFLDRAKAMRVIQAAMAAYALPTLLFPYSSSFLQVAAIRTVQGFVSTAFWVAIEKRLSDLVSLGERGRVMSYYNVSWSGAFIVGPSLAGLIIEAFHFGSAFLVAFLWQAAALLVLVGLTHQEEGKLTIPTASPTEGEGGTGERPWEAGDLIAACLTVGMAGLILGLLFSLFPAYLLLLGFSPLRAGCFFLLFSVARVTAFLGIGRVIDSIGEHKFMLAGMVLSVSVVTLGSTTRPELLALGLVLLGVGSGMTYTGALTLISRAPSKSRGSSIGKFEISFSLGIAVMAQLEGVTADLFRPSIPYVLSGVITVIGSVALLTLILTSKRPKPI